MNLRSVSVCNGNDLVAFLAFAGFEFSSSFSPSHRQEVQFVGFRSGKI